MPVEIKELIVQANINGEEGKKATYVPKKTDSKSSSGSSSGVVGRITHDLRRQLVEDCVIEVLDQLQKNRML